MEAVLDDIEDAAGAAAELIRRGREAWDEDRLLRLAGEAVIGWIADGANRLPNEVKSAVPEIPWDDFRDIRILVDHIYHRVDYDALWETLATDVPDLLGRLHRWRTSRPEPPRGPYGPGGYPHRTRSDQEHTMKAIVQDRYGSPDDLELRAIDEPVAGDDDVLVRVRAASLHADVWHVVRGQPYVLRIMGAGLRRPKNPVPGTDLAGDIETVGRNVKRFRPGDEVFGQTVGANLWGNGGAYAEFAAVPEARLELKPADLTFEQAAAVPTSGPIAVQGLRDEGRIQPGQKVLINGAGGGVGTFAVQLAKAYGADVTGVDSTGKLDMLRSIGAHQVVDFTQEDFTQRGERYDLILDIPGNHPWSDLRRALTPEGTYVLIGHDQYGRAGRRWIGSLGRFARLLVMSPFVSQLHGLRGAKDPGDRLVVLKELIEAGKITPVIDRTFPLGEVPEAIRYLESGQAGGKIVITM